MQGLQGTGAEFTIEPIGTQINVRLKTVHNGWRELLLKCRRCQWSLPCTEAEKNNAEANQNTNPIPQKELHFNIIGLSSLSSKLQNHHFN